MRAAEFVVEAVATPYNIDFSSNVTFKRKQRQGQAGVTGRFTTADGIEYLMRGLYMGPTKKERDDEKAYQDAQKRKAERGEEDPFWLPDFSDDKHGGIWEIHFDAYHPEDDEDERKGYKTTLTGRGDEFRVFATVVAFVKRIVSQFHPEIVSIKSANAEESRATLYKRLIDRFAAGEGYKHTKTVRGPEKTRMELRRVDNK